MTRWVALFSQTGTEIVEICEELGVWPSRIFTNNPDVSKINPKLKGKVTIMSHKGIQETLGYESEYTAPAMVTMHGYLRILSEDVCKSGLQIYNGHPGLITRYPELKGKDPQERVIGNDYEFIGSVVHRVTPEVDEGEIVSYREVKNVASSTDSVYNILRNTSKDAWLDFLKGKL